MHKCDFSIGHYETIMKSAFECGYKFIFFNDVEKYTRRDRICVLRHDVDYLPEWSLNLADIERRLGIRSTYFFQLKAKPYNIFEIYNKQVVRDIHDMGHRIGLHFDVISIDSQSIKNVVKLCRQDKKIFESLLGIRPIDIVSIHCPTKDMLCKDIPGVRHTYEKRYFADMKYLSDSQGWREGCMCTVFAKRIYPKIQLLIHPYIWHQTYTDDFIKNMSIMIKFRRDELVNYMITYHPVCRKNAGRLKNLVVE